MTKALPRDGVKILKLKMPSLHFRKAIRDVLKADKYKILRKRNEKSDFYHSGRSIKF
jgi:hypothetical protein